MNYSVNVNKNVVTLTYNLSDKEIELLIKCGENKYIEIRDTEDEVDEICSSLANHGFVENDMDAWHLTYTLTPLGKYFYENYK